MSQSASTPDSFGIPGQDAPARSTGATNDSATPTPLTPLITPAETKVLYEEAQRMAGKLVEWRRDLHQTPELGLDLPQTSAYVKARLDEMGIPYTTLVGGSCVVATLGHGGKCFMLRSDFDALPVEEESGEPFASTNGHMHACGHDLHAAILLGAAKLLKEREDELPGVVKLMFQPGEEGYMGASVAIREGVLENPKVDAAFAMHVFAMIPLGQIAWGSELTASCYSFRINIRGRGGHGSTPQDCIDPINVGVRIYLALQELIAREVSPQAEVALTVGKFQAGETTNVIPEYAELAGTLRTFDDSVHDYVVRRITELSESLARAYRAEATVELVDDVPSTICDAGLNAEIKGVINQTLPDVKIIGPMHAMGSEDFGFVTRKVPATYMCIGAMPDDGKGYSQHNPKIRFNEKALPMGAAVYAATAIDWLKRNAR